MLRGRPIYASTRLRAASHASYYKALSESSTFAAAASDGVPFNFRNYVTSQRLATTQRSREEGRHVLY
jgi:hypothetical protein